LTLVLAVLVLTDLATALVLAVLVLTDLATALVLAVLVLTDLATALVLAVLVLAVLVLAVLVLTALVLAVLVLAVLILAALATALVLAVLVLAALATLALAALVTGTEVSLGTLLALLDLVAEASTCALVSEFPGVLEAFVNLIGMLAGELLRFVLKLGEIGHGSPPVPESCGCHLQLGTLVREGCDQNWLSGSVPGGRYSAPHHRRSNLGQRGWLR